jgi:hypothetical protein
MSQHAKPPLKPEILVDIKAPDASLRILSDGCGTLSLDGTDLAFGREIGRYALRRLYLGTWGNDHDSRTIRKMSSEILGCLRCRRPDCKQPIPEQRRLNGFERDVPPKYCSTRCQSTEGTRRWHRRHGL